MNRKPRLEQLAERKTTHPITTHPTSKPPFLMEHTHRIVHPYQFRSRNYRISNRKYHNKRRDRLSAKIMPLCKNS